MPIYFYELLVSLYYQKHNTKNNIGSADKGRVEDAHKENKNKSVLLEVWWGIMPQMRRRYLKILR